MSWFLLALVSIFTVSIAILLERVLMKDENSDPISYAIVFQFLLGLISLILSLAFGKFVLPQINYDTILRFSLSSILWAGATVFGFYAIKRISAGEITIIATAGTVISIVLGILFLGETPKFLAIVGALLIFVAIFILNTNKLSFASKIGIVFALIAAFCSGIAVVNDAFILKTYEAFSYTTIMSFLPGVVLLILFPKKLTKMKNLINVKYFSLMFVFCLFYSIQAITYYSALNLGAPISQLSPLAKSSIVVTVVLAAIFLKERSNLLRKIIAAIMVTVGAVLIG